MRRWLSVSVLLSLTGLSLSACHLLVEKKTEPTQSVEQNSSQPSQDKVEETEIEPSETKQEEATTSFNQDTAYNGSYYSVQGQFGEVIIVNKKHPLASDYNPGENREASQAFHQLQADMQSLGYDVSSQYSGFRSYDTQAGLYQSYVAQDGQANADRYSARPGYSEHQTGLAYDLLDNSGQLLTDLSATQWLAQNAHRYGFIVRYLPDKEAITGYMAESWHVRYIGDEAEAIYQSGLTLEEYFGVSGGNYPD